MPTHTLSVHCKWMVRTDMPAVMTIEQLCFPSPWTEDEFIRVLRQRNCIGIVAKDGDRVVGFMVYEIHKHRFQLLNIAVDPSRQRWGVGSALLRVVFGKMSEERRKRIFTEVRESNLDAQLFFKSHGFKAVSVLRDFYDDSTEDAYVMQYRLPRCENETKPNAK